VAVALALALSPACRPVAATAPQATVEETPAEAPSVPVEAPRCEALSEGCAATPETVLSVPSSLSFTPPLGWTYAAQPTQAAARSADGKAVLAFAASSGDVEQRDDRQKILARLQSLVQGLGVSEVDFARLEKRLKKPDTEIEEEGSFPISLWEVGEEQQAGRSPVLGGNTPGTLLIVTSTTPVGLLLLGAAFVTPDVAADQAPRIMDSVKSLRLVEPQPIEPAKAAEENPSEPGPDAPAQAKNAGEAKAP
jgi:hypothetical protein